MAPAMGQLIGQIHAKVWDSNTNASRLSGLFSLEKTYGQELEPRLLHSESRIPPLGSNLVEPENTNPLNGLLTPRKTYGHGLSAPLSESSTLMPPDCVTADSSNELLRKICDTLEPDFKNSTNDHIHVDSTWNIVIGGIIFFTCFMLILAIINKTIVAKARRGNTYKSIDRPSTCEEPFDMSYQLEKSLPPGEVKFQLCPGSDEDDWTDSFCRKHYAPLVHYPVKPKKIPTYHTF